MKGLLIGALLGILPLGVAQAAPTATYKSCTRVTLAAIGISSTVYSLQNTASSGGQDVLVRKIEISNASTMTVTGGLMQFWVYLSTSLSHSAAVTTAYSHTGALASQPSYVTVSTKPYNVQAEGDSGILSTGGGLSGVPPPVRPLYVNNDETATANLYDFWSEREESVGLGAGKDGPQPIILPAGSQRALVIDKKRLGTADFTDGSLLICTTYTVR